MEDNEELRLTHQKAFMLKEDFSYLLQTAYPGREGKRSDWFEIIVAPYDVEMRKDFLERYLIELPVSYDYNLLKRYQTNDYTVLARYGYKDRPDEYTRPLIEIIREMNLSFNKDNYTS